jgi:hypothetical protein
MIDPLKVLVHEASWSEAMAMYDLPMTVRFTFLGHIMTSLSVFKGLLPGLQRSKLVQWIQIVT